MEQTVSVRRGRRGQLSKFLFTMPKMHGKIMVSHLIFVRYSFIIILTMKIPWEEAQKWVN